MKYAAVIIDDRQNIAIEAIERHKPFLPKHFDVIHLGNIQIKSIRAYNQLLTDPIFWEMYFGNYDRVLIFQHDSGLLRQGVEQFFKYDFIGAPIAHMPGYMNGGLSIRNPKLMYKICKNKPYRGMEVDGNEDIYFVKHLRALGANLPDLKTAKQFSVETIFNMGSLGYHAMDKYLTIDKVDLIMTQYD